jgi:hypothetical protein
MNRVAIACVGILLLAGVVVYAAVLVLTVPH